MKDKKIKKVDPENEMEALIKASKEVKSIQLGLGEEFERNLNVEIIGDSQSPEKSYDLYYRMIYIILKDNLKDLPKDQRDMIYDQKNIFLTRGKVKDDKGKRGGDSRQAYLSDLEAVVEIIINWVKEGANPVNLYNAFRDKNLELGWLKEKSV